LRGVTQMNEDLKRDLIRIMQEKSELYDKKKADILKNKENIDVLSNLVATLEDNPTNLKIFSREDLTKMLSIHHSNETIQKTLNRLEIARLVISLQDRGVDVDFNEEELNILVEFIEMMRGIRDGEIAKFQQIVDSDVKQLDDRMLELETIQDKITKGANGTEFINKKEIDSLMHLVIEREADDLLQISVLRLLNKVNIGIYASYM